MNPAEWAKIATEIESNYDQFDGFVVLHGSDTMSYSASALSFMLDNLAKPVILPVRSCL
jgi:L-asparaginase